MLAVKKFYFGGRFWRSLPSRRTPKFGPNNCLTNNFLHCEFQFSMLSSSKVSFWGVRPPGGSPNLVKTIVSQTSSYIVSFNFLCWAVQKFYFLGAIFGGLSPGGQFAQIRSKKLSHKQLPTLWVSSFCVEQFKTFILGEPFFSFWRTLKFGPNNYLTNKFLHSEFRLSMLSNSKLLFRGGPFLGGLPLLEDP